jgi:glucose-6-phosphate isomerase
MKTTLADRLLNDAVVEKIWKRDPSTWKAAPGSADAKSIASRLGWLDVGDTMKPHMTAVHRLGEQVRDEKFEAAYLLGMGGSSLCAEVLRSVFGVADGYPQLHVLDTTDELTLATAASRLDPARTLFIVASKSGGTVEVASMERFFWAHMTEALGADAGRHFVAVTDPDTALQSLAEKRGYREVFINPPDIGGRFSALSLFGLVPAALVGRDPRQLLSAGSAMAEGCRQENHTNAGLELGAFIGAAAAAGRDKLTLILPDSIRELGLWIEQLVAESTGKSGKGVLPVVDEPLGRVEDYGQDRAFVAIGTDRDAPDAATLAALEAADHPVLRLTTRMDGLGSEFFRWEFATAVAGAALGVNPFDEPNVAEAKTKTRTLLDAYAAQGRLPEEDPLAADTDVAIHTLGFAGPNPATLVSAAVKSLQPGDYVAFLSYLPPSSALDEALAGARVAIRARKRTATTSGIGPRYLHSTGQYHKGGPNAVLAFVITADDETATEVPGSGYTFSVLKRAQALGDVQALEGHGRRVLRLHIRGKETEAILARLFAEALA